MSFGKRLKITVGSLLVYAVVRLLYATWRVKVVGQEHRDAAGRAHPQGSFCLAIWHEYLCAGILVHAGQRFAPLASLSSDGDVVTFVMKRLGFRPCRGSSSRGGTEARDEMVTVTSEGWFTAITVDGPRGPRRQVKGGVVDVARRTGVMILPTIAAADREWVLEKSWDKFKIPKPFSRVVLQYDPPIAVPAETSGLEFGELKNRVKDAIDTAETHAREALRAWGRAP